MRMSDFGVISSDSHILEPADLWEKRIDREFMERGPRLVREGEYDQWYCDGLAFGDLGTLQQFGLRFEEPEKLSTQGRMETLPLGGLDLDAHVKDMDLDGVDGGVLYPSQGLTMYRVPASHVLSAACMVVQDVGVDNLMWGSDYPHAESTFPRSRETVDRITQGIPEEEKAKILK